MEKMHEDWFSNLCGQPDRRCQGKKNGMKVTHAPDQHRRCPGPANMPALSTHLSCANRPDSCTLTPGINSITPTIIETTSEYSSAVTPTTAFAFTTTTTVPSDEDSLLNCPQCDHTFASRIGLVSHL
ncbi:unnamed protein product [Schistocephalus solidus]|uniref:C2H2-type domain-containing protein n=1 Tax=Schistocephalus solidus TaxID=70667 RepID=A0A183SEB0_SCHSO|nr:unnamed protein product [Schistocephalus solidus]